MNKYEEIFLRNLCNEKVTKSYDTYYCTDIIWSDKYAVKNNNDEVFLIGTPYLSNYKDIDAMLNKLYLPPDIFPSLQFIEQGANIAVDKLLMQYWENVPVNTHMMATVDYETWEDMKFYKYIGKGVFNLVSKDNDDKLKFILVKDVMY